MTNSASIRIAVRSFFLVSICTVFAFTTVRAEPQVTETLTGTLQLIWLDAWEHGQIVPGPVLVTLVDLDGAEHTLDLDVCCERLTRSPSSSKKVGLANDQLLLLSTPTIIKLTGAPS